MKIIILSIKNILTHRQRTLTIGIFIFLTTVIMLFFYSFIEAVQEKINHVIINGMTGHIQIRSDRTFEGDMVANYQKNWSSISVIHSETVQRIKKILKESFYDITFYSLVRQAVYLHHDQKSGDSFLFGIEPDYYHYRDIFEIKKGEYLSSEKPDEILLTVEQAKKLNLDVGNEVVIKTKDKRGLIAEKRFTIVGIGNFIFLSFFSYNACYVDIRSLKNFLSLNDNEVTDIILYIPEKKKSKKMIQKIHMKIEENGIEVERSGEEKIASDDIKIKNIDLDEFGETGKNIKISSYLEMGKMFKSLHQILSVISNIFIALLLLIIILLIINIVVLMVIERFYEIGTLRAIGFSRKHIILIFLLEIMIITLFFTLIGLLSGVLLLLYLNHLELSAPIPAFEALTGHKITFYFKPLHFIIIMLVLNILSLAASFFPVFNACLVKPVDILKDQ